MAEPDFHVPAGNFHLDYDNPSDPPEPAVTEPSDEEDPCLTGGPYLCHDPGIGTGTAHFPPCPLAGPNRLTPLGEFIERQLDHEAALAEPVRDAIRSSPARSQLITIIENATNEDLSYADDCAIADALIAAGYLSPTEHAAIVERKVREALAEVEALLDKYDRIGDHARTDHIRRALAPGTPDQDATESEQ